MSLIPGSRAGVRVNAEPRSPEARGSLLPLEERSAVEMETAAGRWTFEWRRQAGAAGVAEIRLDGRLLEGVFENGEVAFEQVFDGWTEDAYLLVPSAAYRGNRFPAGNRGDLASRASACPSKLLIDEYVPRLPFGSEAVPCPFEIPLNHCASPYLGLYFPDQGSALFWVFPANMKAGFRIGEDLEANILTVQVAAPLVRARRISPTAGLTPAEDPGLSLQAGDTFTIAFEERRMRCPDLATFFTLARGLTCELLERRPPAAPLLSFSQCFELQEEKFNRDNWEEASGIYQSFLVPGRPGCFETGWTGGMQAPYPLMALGGAQTRERCLRSLGVCFGLLQTGNGLFYSLLRGGMPGGESAGNQHLLRRSGDALFYLLKQLACVDTHPSKQDWERGARRCAERLCAIIEESDGVLPQYVHQESGTVAVPGSTSAAIVIAALVEAADYFSEPAFLESACRAAAAMDERYLGRGIFGGGPNDACQTPDSESAYALVEAFTALYEGTGEERWLRAARTAADLFATWVSGCDFRFPAGSTQERLGFTTRGTVWANLRNKHAAPGICTYGGSALLRLYRLTGDEDYGSLLCYIVRAIPQFLSRPDRPIPAFPDFKPLPSGWMNEVVFINDQNAPYANPFASPPGEFWAGSCWCEVSLLLGMAELPGVYADLKTRRVWSFDHVECSFERDRLRIVNPTSADARVTVWLDACREDYKPADVRFTEVRIPASSEATLDPGVEVDRLQSMTTPAGSTPR